MGHGSSTPETVRRYVGNCQVCEGDFKTTKGGLVALHGYKRPGDGYIRGRCPGENALAYERSRDLIPAVIEMYDRAVAGHDDTLRRIDRGEVESFQRKTYAPPYHAEVRRSEVAPDEWERRLQGFRATVKKMRDDADERRRHLPEALRRLVAPPAPRGRRAGPHGGAEGGHRGEEGRARRGAEGQGRTRRRRSRPIAGGSSSRGGGSSTAPGSSSARPRRGATARARSPCSASSARRRTRPRSNRPSRPRRRSRELKLRGLVPDDLTGAGEAIGYEWEEDLDADQALLALDLARLQREPEEGGLVPQLRALAEVSLGVGRRMPSGNLIGFDLEPGRAPLLVRDLLQRSRHVDAVSASACPDRPLRGGW